jgi:hypothetical protein
MMTASSPTPRLLRRDDAADYVRHTWGLPCSRGLLAKLAVIGGGPVFRRAGKWPLYQEVDLDAWAKSKISGPLTKTSDAPIDRVEKSKPGSAA